MVSRQHAEFRLQNGRWFVSDSTSTHGTFLNGQLLKAPAELRKDSRIQFGTDGPVLVVTGIGQEVGTEATLVSRSSTSVPSPARSASPLHPHQVFSRTLRSDFPKPLKARQRAGICRTVRRRNGKPQENRTQQRRDSLRTRSAELKARSMRLLRWCRAVMQKFDAWRQSMYSSILEASTELMLNGKRIAAPEVLHHRTISSWATEGPTIRFVHPAQSGAPPRAASR